MSSLHQRRRGLGMLLLSALLALLLIDPVSAFLPSSTSSSKLLSTPLRRRVASGSSAVVRMAADGGNSGNNNGGKRELDRLFEEMERANTRSPMGDAIKETVDRIPLPTIPTPSTQPDRPFRFPAYGFLLLSALLGISFTGSLTELATGHPLFGQAATLAIVAAAGPGFIGSFVIAVKRYNEEREEDNARLEEEERRQEAEQQQAVQGPVMIAGRDGGDKEKEGLDA